VKSVNECREWPLAGDIVQACVAAMVRIEHMDFLLPMKIGEVAELTAEIVYTSTHSLLVAIDVHAENIITGTHTSVTQ